MFSWSFELELESGIEKTPFYNYDYSLSHLNPVNHVNPVKKKERKKWNLK